MPTYTVTAHHTCMRCGATAKREEPADIAPDGTFRARAKLDAHRWRDVTLPHPTGPLVRGEMCPDCVAQLAAFVLPPKAP